MDQYDYLTRDQLVSLVRALGAGTEAGRGPAPGSTQELQEFSERARLEFKNSASPMRIFDHETLKFLAVNDAAVAFYGYSREEFLALTMRQTRHPDEHAAQLASFREPAGYLRYGKPRRQIKKSGEIAVVEVVTQDILFNGRKARLTLTIDISAQLRMQELLWKRQQEFESLAENLPDLVARFDREHRFLYANSAIETTTGIDRGQIIGKTQLELGMPADVVAVFKDSLAGVFSTGLPHKLEFRLALPSGERRFEAHHVPEMDATGAIGSVLCVARDITERTRIEIALRETNEYLHSVIESSRDCIKVLDLEGRLQLMNAGGRRLLEIDEIAPLFNTEWLDFWHGADRAGASAALDAARNGGVGTFEGYCPTWKGSPRWWDVVVAPILDADGKPARLLAVSRDVTRRKRARDVENRLAAIVKYSMDAVISMDLGGIIRTWNPAAERIYGLSEGEAVGQPISKLIPPERRGEEALILERIRSGLTIEPFDSVRCRKDGSRVDVSLSVSPIKDEAGQVIGASKFVRDITERRQSELAELRNAALAKLLESLARAANEARTPEAAMAACLERICRYGRWVLGRVEVFDPGRSKEIPGRSKWHFPEPGRFDDFIQFTESHVRTNTGPLVGRLLRERSAVWIEDLQRIVGYRRWERAVGEGLRSAFAFPVIVRSEVVAFMEVFSEEARPPDPYIMGAAESLASQLARIVEREWAHEANARMAAIVEFSRDPIVSRTLDGTIRTWNPAAERLFGYAAAEIVGRNIKILYPPEITADMLRRQNRVIDGMPVEAYETVRLTKDGRRVHVTTSPSAIRDSSGKICGVSTIVRDNTERKLAEQALRESEERFRQIAENIDSVFWINTPAVDKNLYVSPAYEKIWGKSCESVRSNPNSWKESIHPEDRPRAGEAVAGVAKGVHMDVEYRIIRPDGTIRWIRDRSYPMKSGDGDALVCGIAEDVTVRKQAEQDRLTHAIQQRDALVREVHHRIKNNLQGVAGLLRQKIRKFPAVAPGIEEAIVQLQAVAVVYGLQGTRADGLLSLSEMVEAICASAESLIGGRVDRILERKSARPACVAGTEAVSIAVALNELVFNALKHQSAPAGKKRAQVALCETGDAAEIRIINRGRLPKRFDYSSDRAIGNGLALVRTLLASPGASVEFISGRNNVEVLLKLKPPLLSERQSRPTRRN